MCRPVKYAWRHAGSGIHRNVAAERLYPLAANDPGFMADKVGNALNIP